MSTSTPVVMDYETALLDGTPSLDYYREDFRVVSTAFSWRENGVLQTYYTVGETPTLAFLAVLKARGCTLVVHNLQFEYGVTAARFQGYEDLITVDTMRLTQVADNGGREAYQQIADLESYEAQLDAAEKGDTEEDYYSKGLSLVACSSRHLPAEYQNHKEPSYALIRERTGCKRGQEGKNLNALTYSELETYNVADARVTLALYEKLIADFDAIKYGWQFDHMLYVGSAKDIARSKSSGVEVDRPALEAYALDLAAEIEAINLAFRARFEREITELETVAQEAWIDELKTAKGRVSRRAQVEANSEEFRFNVGSNKQLKILFIDKLKVLAKFWTSESKKSKAKREADPALPPFNPSPSFRAAHLSSYGDGGELLITRRKRMLVLSQVRAMLELSAYDGKWHIEVKCCGTATGRLAGGRV